MSNFKLPNQIKPEDEALRLAKLYAYDILDTPADDNFDRIAKLATQIFNVVYAQINFIDKDKVFHKANINQFKTIDDRERSLCSIAILNDTITVFEDTTTIPTLAANTFIAVENGIRFYAGAPLQTPEGFNLGTICILDTKPRSFTLQEQQMLENLSAIIMDQLALRLTMRTSIRTQTDMMNRVIHDLKNPNTTISLSAELIRRKADDQKLAANFAERIKTSADHVLDSLNRLLDISQLENGSFRLQIEEVDVLSILVAVKKDLALVAKRKNQQIAINCNCSTLILADARRLKAAFYHLLNNAIKYSAKNSTIAINVSTADGKITIEFKDNGQGLTDDDLGKLFVKFAKLSAVPTNREYTNGLGLSTVKMLVELHQGKVYAKSAGKDKGASFFVELGIS